MKIGIPRERKVLEKRVALTPGGALDLIKEGHQVVVESGAGVGSGFANSDYERNGATISNSLAEIWNTDLVVKVKEPHPDEFSLMSEKTLLFDYLHLAAEPEVMHALTGAKMTALSYELIKEGNRLPLLEPMSEIAGKLSVINGSNYLLQQNGGRGVLLSDAFGVEAATVVVIGAGIAGTAAAELACNMGAKCIVFDVNEQKLNQILEVTGGRVEARFSNSDAIGKALIDADLVIGAVLVPGAKAPKIVTRAMVEMMKPGSVLVDISIDQGGMFETIKPTNLDKPVYSECGVVHYGVCNMPGQTPVTSTLALTARTLPYIKEIARGGLDAIAKNEVLRGAVNTHKGKIANQEVANAFGLKAVPF